MWTTTTRVLSSPQTTSNSKSKDMHYNVLPKQECPQTGYNNHYGGIAVQFRVRRRPRTSSSPTSRLIRISSTTCSSKFRCGFLVLDETLLLRALLLFGLNDFSKLVCMMCVWIMMICSVY